MFPNMLGKVWSMYLFYPCVGDCPLLIHELLSLQVCKVYNFFSPKSCFILQVFSVQSFQKVVVCISLPIRWYMRNLVFLVLFLHCKNVTYYCDSIAFYTRSSNRGGRCPSDHFFIFVHFLNFNFWTKNRK